MLPFHRSLRFRVAITFVLLSVSIDGVLTLALGISRERSLIGALDRRLALMATGLSALVQEHGVAAVSSEGLSSTLGARLPADSWFAQVRDSTQRVIASESTLATGEVPDSVWNNFLAQLDGATAEGMQTRTVPLPLRESTESGREHQERARVGLVRLHLGKDQTCDLFFGVSMEVADGLTRTLGRTLLMTACGATVAAGLAGWVVASLLSMRVRRITDAMRAVTPKALSAGLRVPEGTDEIGQVGAALNTMLAGLERAFRSQERFISDVSHELKTPLAALLTQAQVLHGGEPTESDFRAFVASAEEEARRLGKLVESFLMLTRFDHGKRFVAEELVSVNDAVLEAMQKSEPFAGRMKVALRVTVHDAADECDEGTVQGDFELLRVAVDNVIRNAVQISKAGDTVHVGVECADGHMVVSVRDSGPGVHPDHLDRIFDRFHQAPSRESGSRGTGLGLAIAKAIIDLHRGTIHAANHAEGGCLFVMRLPLAGRRSGAGGEQGA